MKTYNTLYLEARNELMNAGFETAREDARNLLAFASGKSLEKLTASMQLYASTEVEKLYSSLMARRLKEEPVAYITGVQVFYGLPFFVDRNVLIPRIDTEVLVKEALSCLNSGKKDARILDLCCGSGCIGCTVANYYPKVSVLEADISEKALEICHRNISNLQLSPRVICMQLDALNSPPPGLGKFDIILCNPPYIATDEVLTLDASVIDYEPLEALDGGDDGLKFYRAIIKKWKSALNEKGIIIFEAGEGQAEPVKKLLLDNGFSSVRFSRDDIGTDRVITGIL